MEIRSARFVKSSSDYKQCEGDSLPEYAFIGRSNVGKSSLINSVLNKKGLAKTSSTPGKTQLINQFIINEEWYLTDLPGYGYAKVSKKSRKKFSKLNSDYLQKRPNLINVFVLIDSRHDPQKIDLEFIQYLGEQGIPFSLVYTKKDKLRGRTMEDTLSSYKIALRDHWEEHPPYFISSSKTGEGKEEILTYIEEINSSLQ